MEEEKGTGRHELHGLLMLLDMQLSECKDNIASLAARSLPLPAPLPHVTGLLFAAG